jgi:hypothetical protein
VVHRLVGVSRAIGGSTPNASAVSMTMFFGSGPMFCSDELGMKSIG